MADNQSENEIIELTEKAVSTPSDRHEQASNRPAQASSIPPKPVSPFQQLVGPNDPAPEPEPEKEEGPSFPVVEKRSSFVPKPEPVPVLIMPIQQVSSAPPKPISGESPDSPASPAPPLKKKTAPKPAAAPEKTMSDIPSASASGEGREDEQIFDLSDEMVVETPSSNPKDAAGVAPDPSTEAEVSTPPKTPDVTNAPQDTDDDDNAESIESVDPVETDKNIENDPKEEEEELDLTDAEEMTHTGPPALPPGTKDGRRPIIRRRRKQNKEWWARIFNDDYVSTIPKATVRGDQRKVSFIEKSLALPDNALVLDLACGNGRHSVGMAKKGYRMVGIDLSLPMLAQAAELAQEENQNINFIHGDMRDLSFDKTFDAIFCMGTSFGYFDDEANAGVVQGVFRALKPGGSFLLETANRDHVVGQTPELTWFEGNGSICMEETAFDYKTSRLIVTRQLIMDGGRQVQNDISIRVYSLHEINRMLSQTGFDVGTVSGHTATPGAFFGPDSVRIFVCAKRPR